MTAIETMFIPRADFINFLITYASVIVIGALLAIPVYWIFEKDTGGENNG